MIKDFSKMSSVRLETSFRSFGGPSARTGKRRHTSKPLGTNKPEGLSFDDQDLLKRLLITISKGERSIERQRQVLASLNRFEPHSAFQRIDRDQDGKITSLEILKFLRDNGVEEATEADTHYIIRYFDSDDDERMTYEDLMQMVMPCDDQYLRAAIAQRDIYEVLKHDFLDAEIEAELTRLFEKEVALNRVTEEMKQEMCSSKSFCLRKAFDAIDDWKYGFIDKKNLKSFLRKHNYLASTAECMAIIRRLDVDADARLSKNEFMAGLKPEEPFNKTIKRAQRKRGTGTAVHTRLPRTGLSIKDGQQTMYQKESGRSIVRNGAFDRQQSKGGFGIGTTPLKSRPVVQQDLSMFTSPPIGRTSSIRPRKSQSRRKLHDDQYSTAKLSHRSRRVSQLKRQSSAIAGGGRRKKEHKPKALKMKSSRSHRRLRRDSSAEDEVLERLAQPIDHTKLRKRYEMEQRMEIKRSKLEAQAQGVGGAYSSRESRNRSRSVHRSRSARKMQSSKKEEKMVRGGKLMIKKYKSFVKQFGKAGAEANNSYDRAESDSDDNWRGPSDFTRLSQQQSKDELLSNRDSVQKHRSRSRRSARKLKNSRTRSRKQLIAREISEENEDPRSYLTSNQRSLEKSQPLRTDLLIQSQLTSDNKSSVISEQRKPVYSVKNGTVTNSRDQTPPAEPVGLCNILPRADEGFFLRCLQEIIAFEQELEAQKVNLSLRDDFNLIDAFGMLDHDGKGNLNPQELHVSLRRLDIPATQDDCYLVFHRINRNMDGLLKYSEFSATFMPVDQHCARQLGSKRLQYSASVRSAFSPETMQHYCQVWALIVRIEQRVEQIKDKLNGRPTFNIDSAFRSLDQNFIGHITAADIKNLMLEYNLRVSPEDMQLLVYRFDSDKDSKISFLEFKQAFTPHRLFLYQVPTSSRPLSEQELRDQIP